MTDERTLLRTYAKQLTAVPLHDAARIADLRRDFLRQRAALRGKPPPAADAPVNTRRPLVEKAHPPPLSLGDLILRILVGLWLLGIVVRLIQELP